MFDKLTLIIPTKNRHSYLERIIDYYSTSKINILVADASKEKYVKKLPANITYHHYPEVPYCTKLDDILKKVSTPYSLLCADDDFIIPGAIEKCLNFLITHPDYKSAQGNYVVFYKSKNQLFYSPAYLSTVGSDFNEEKATDRIKKFNNLSIQFYYCIHTTETLKEVFHAARNKLYNLNLVELLIGMNTVIQGKHKVLPVFYSARESLYSSAGTSAGLDIISVAPEYKEQYQIFFSETSQLLSKKENISLEKASIFLKQSIENHIKHRYNNKFSLKKLIITSIKKTIPLNIRKHFRHYFLLIQKSKKQKKNLLSTSKMSGFPFTDGADKKELERIESYIFKYNI